MQEERPSNLLRVDPSVRDEQIDSLNRLKSERNNEKVDRALAKLKDGAESKDNLMPLVFEAVKEYSTLGEICDVLREVFGEYQQINTLS